MAMTARPDFTVQEWQVLRDGPPSAALLVAAAQPGGAIRESLALSLAYAQERGVGRHGQLLDDIVSWTPEIGRMRYHSVEELRERCTQNLRDAVELVQEKATPAEVDEYRRFVLALAHRIARAHREGFLGLSGPRVSAAERAAVQGITDALGSAATLRPVPLTGPLKGDE
jgi:hypothetical protein